MAFQFGVDNASAALTTAERYVLSAFSVDKNLQTVTTDYTMQVGTNSVKLGDNIKLSAGNKVLCVSIDNQYYFVVLKPLEEGGGIDYINVTSGQQILSTQTTYDTTISSGTTAIGTHYSASYDEIVYNITMKPAAIGYMKVTIYSGTDTTGDILFNKVTQITSDLVGEDITFTDPFLLNQGDDIYVVVSGVDVLGDSNNAPYTSVVIYQASLSDLQHYDAPTEDHSILQGSSDGSTVFTTTPSVQTLDVLGDTITLGSEATTSTSVTIGNPDVSNTITINFLTSGNGNSYDGQITVSNISDSDYDSNGETEIRIDSTQLNVGGEANFEKNINVDDTATISSYTTIGSESQIDNMLSVTGTTLLDGELTVSNETDESGANIYGNLSATGDIVGEGTATFASNTTIGDTTNNTDYTLYNSGNSYLSDNVVLGSDIFVSKYDGNKIVFTSSNSTLNYASTIYDYGAGNLTLATNDIIEIAHISDTSTGDQDDTAIWIDVLDTTITINSTSSQTDYPLYVGGNTYSSGYVYANQGVKMSRSSDEGVGLQIFNTSGEVVSWITDNGSLSISTDDTISFANFDNAESPTLNTAYTYLYMTDSASYLTINNSSANKSYNLYNGGTTYLAGALKSASTATFASYTTVGTSTNNTSYTFYNAGTTGLSGVTTMGDNTAIDGTLTIGSLDTQTTYDLSVSGTGYFSDLTYLYGGTLLLKGVSNGINFGTGTNYIVSKIFDYSSGNLTLATDDVIEFRQITDTSDNTSSGMDDTAMWMSVQDKVLVINNDTYTSSYNFYNGGTSYQAGKASFAGAIVGSSTLALSGTATLASYTTIGQSSVNTSYTLYNAGTTGLNGAVTVAGATTLKSTLGVTGVITGSSNAIIAGDLTVGQSTLKTNYDLYNAGTTGLSGALTVAGVSTFNNKVNIARSSSYGLNFMNSSTYFSRIYDDGNLIIATDDYIEFTNLSNTSTGAVSTPYIYMDVDNNTMTINKNSSQSTYTLYVGGNQYNSGYAYAYGGLAAPRTNANGLGLQFKDSPSAAVYSWIFDDGNLNFSTDDYIEFSHMTASASPSIDTPYIYMYLKSGAGYLTVNNSSCNTGYNFYNGGTSWFEGATNFNDYVNFSVDGTTIGGLSSSGFFYKGYTGGGISTGYVGEHLRYVNNISTTYSSGVNTSGNTTISAGVWLVWASFYGTLSSWTSSGAYIEISPNTSISINNAYKAVVHLDDISSISGVSCPYYVTVTEDTYLYCILKFSASTKFSSGYSYVHAVRIA